MNTNNRLSNQEASLGAPRFFLRLEGLVWFSFSLYLFHYFQGAWWIFAVLFFAPDLSLIGYLLGPRVGAIFYNALHSEVGPVVLASGSFLFAEPNLLNLSLIWFCHINFDRMLGIGLKYFDNFQHTHLGLISFRKRK